MLISTRTRPHLDKCTVPRSIMRDDSIRREIQQSDQPLLDTCHLGNSVRGVAVTNSICPPELTKNPATSAEGDLFNPVNVILAKYSLLCGYPLLQNQDPVDFDGRNSGCEEIGSRCTRCKIQICFSLFPTGLFRPTFLGLRVTRYTHIDITCAISITCLVGGAKGVLAERTTANCQDPAVIHLTHCRHCFRRLSCVQLALG